MVGGGGDYIPRQKVESRFGEKSRGDLKVDSWSKNMMKGKGIEVVYGKRHRRLRNKL